jgi:hypothetical protein
MEVEATTVEGGPVLKLIAQDPKEREQLTELLDVLHRVQREALMNGRAGLGNPCGSGSDSQGVFGLAIPIYLGDEDSMAELGRKVVALVSEAGSR